MASTMVWIKGLNIINARYRERKSTASKNGRYPPKWLNSSFIFTRYLHRQTPTPETYITSYLMVIF